MTVFLPIKPTSLQFSVSSNSYTVMCSDPMIILIEHTDQFLPLKGLQHSWVLLFWMPSKTIFSIFPEIQFVLLRMSQYNTKFSGTKRTKTKAFSFSFCHLRGLSVLSIESLHFYIVKGDTLRHCFGTEDVAPWFKTLIALSGEGDVVTNTQDSHNHT